MKSAIYPKIKGNLSRPFSSKSLRWAIFIIVITAISGFLASQTPVQAVSTCVTSGPASSAYTVTVCITNPADRTTLTGDSPVTGTVIVSPAPAPGAANPVQRIVFYLGGDYLLTDYQSPYNFILPTTRWIDGSYPLAVEAKMRDGFVTNQSVIQVNFNNGVTSIPVNTRQFTPAPGTNPQLPDDPLIVAAVGDGAGGETSATNVTNLIGSWNPNLFLYLGDVYENGTSTEFYNWYGQGSQFYSQFRSITNPTNGNHEYTNGVAPGYFDYWDNVPHYYSFNARGWHFISLDANSSYGQTGVGSTQYQWLAQDLASNTAACILAYWHEPIYNIGKEPSAAYMQAVWSLLVQSKVDIVLNGHDHDYQRWVPLDGIGQPSPNGITEFVVGTGGHGIQTFVTTDTRMAAGFDSITNPSPLGALRLRLYTTHAAYDFINTSNNFLDTGLINCKNAGSTGNPTPTSTPTSTSTPIPTSTPTQKPIPTIISNPKGILPFKLFLPEVFRIP